MAVYCNSAKGGGTGKKAAGKARGGKKAAGGRRK